MLRKIGRDKKYIKQKLDAILSEIFIEQKKRALRNQKHKVRNKKLTKEKYPRCLKKFQAKIISTLEFYAQQVPLKVKSMRKIISVL